MSEEIDREEIKDETHQVQDEQQEELDDLRGRGRGRRIRQSIEEA